MYLTSCGEEDIGGFYNDCQNETCKYLDKGSGYNMGLDTGNGYGDHGELVVDFRWR